MNAPIRMRLPRPMLAALVPDGLTVEQGWVVLVGEREHLHTTPDGRQVYGDIIAWDPIPAPPLPGRYEAMDAAERLGRASLDTAPDQWHWYSTADGGQVLELWGLADGHEVWPEVAIAPLTALLANEPEAAPAADTTSGQAEDAAPEKPAAPRLMRGDVWRDDSSDEWTVIRQDGRLLLTWDSETRTWQSADSQYGPLTLVERAGYRRTTDTVPAGQLRRGMVVSCKAWEDDAPVTITGWHVIADDACRLEFEYRPLGGDRTTVVAVGSATKFTLWDEIDGGAR